jgi:hypothetical protein
MKCSITGYCHEHGFWHGDEASELRCGIEKILAEHGDASEGDVFDTYRELCLDVQQLLDCTDARDSLAFEEMKQESGLIIDSDPPPDEEDESDDQIWPRVSAEDLQKLLVAAADLKWSVDGVEHRKNDCGYHDYIVYGPKGDIASTTSELNSAAKRSAEFIALATPERVTLLAAEVERLRRIHG